MAQRQRSPHVWVSSTYFAEGFPYAVVHNLADFVFLLMGANLKQLGLTSLLHLPWNIKFLWGPLLDRFGTKRQWLIAMEVVISILLVVIASLTASGPLLGAAIAVFLAISVAAATHDIAIDALYLAGLDDDEQSKFVGYRAMAYRVAMIVVTGGLVFLGGDLAKRYDPTTGWTVAMFATAGIMGLLTLFHVATLPRPETAARPLRELGHLLLRRRALLLGVGIAGLIALERFAGVFSTAGSTVRDGIAYVIPPVANFGIEEWIGVVLLTVLLGTLAALRPIRRKLAQSDAPYAESFVRFLEQPHVRRILAFVILFRLGESFLGKMRLPFLMQEIGMDEAMYGIANGTVGLSASFVGALLGGALIARHGLHRWIWPFVLAQNVLNLLYAALAAHGDPSLPALFAVIAAERLGEGLGTAVFMVYLMRCCLPEHKAAHFALVSALMSLSFTFAGAASGYLATGLGYAPYFALTFVATLPGMALIPFLPHVRGRDVMPRR
jgi:PAT family beta-lactamase induction signal transducer AmpG